MKELCKRVRKPMNELYTRTRQPMDETCARIRQLIVKDPCVGDRQLQVEKNWMELENSQWIVDGIQ